MNGQNLGIWYWIEKGAEKEFLIKCKNEGCKWLNGEEIDIDKPLAMNRVAVKDKTLAYVPGYMWIAKEYIHAHRVRFQNEDELDQ